MVRFIILYLYFLKPLFLYIYIPIWLDLLYILYNFSSNNTHDLHSNMVRFIMKSGKNLQDALQLNLHSNMVRFIIGREAGKTFKQLSFTFQYG